MIQISALVLRRKLGKIIDRVAKKHEDIIISRNEKTLGSNYLLRQLCSFQGAAGEATAIREGDPGDG